MVTQQLEEILGAKSKGYNVTIKRLVKRASYSNEWYIKKQENQFKKAIYEKVYTTTKKMLEAVKFLVTNVKKANLKMLGTALCDSFYQMMTLKIKGIF